MKFKSEVSEFVVRGFSMPQRIICSKCGDVLYEGDLLKSVQDVIKKFEGRCPNCGKELDFEVDKIFIKANEK
jgi:hypothetical protein